MSGRLRSRVSYGLFAALLAVDVLVAVCEKTAALQAGGAAAGFGWGLITQPWVWMALALGPLQLWVWMRILACTELSVAYPVSAASYPLTMLAAVMVFGERLHMMVWVGALLITVGVAIVGSGGDEGRRAPGGVP